MDNQNSNDKLLQIPRDGRSLHHTNSIRKTKKEPFNGSISQY